MKEKSKLEKAQEKFDQAKARLRQEQARTKAKERKDDTRRKILLGAALLAEPKINPVVEQQVKELIGRMAERDQALFREGRTQ